MNLDSTTCDHTEPTTTHSVLETATAEPAVNDALATTRCVVQNGARLDGIVIGRLVGYDATGNPLVDYVGNAMRHPVVSRAVGVFGHVSTGSQIAMMFEQGDPSLPLILGPIIEPQPTGSESECPEANAGPSMEVTVDKKRLVFEADQEIVLRCGASSITLTRAGKILLRGKYLLSRSSGVNRIKGGSVQIN